MIHDSQQASGFSLAYVLIGDRVWLKFDAFPDIRLPAHMRAVGPLTAQQFSAVCHPGPGWSSSRLPGATRSYRLVSDHERLPDTVRSLQLVAFVCLMLNNTVALARSL